MDTTEDGGLAARPPLPEIPNAADEETMLSAFLDYYRAALLDRAHGLSKEQLATTLAPSSLTLAGLISHMIMVEQSWFRRRFDGEGYTEPWASLDFSADRDAEMSIGLSWSVEQLFAEFEAAVVDSRARASAAESLDQRSKMTSDEGEAWDLRWILIHMIEEYARHCGHADLIRESIDGDIAPD